MVREPRMFYGVKEVYLIKGFRFNKVVLKVFKNYAVLEVLEALKLGLSFTTEIELDAKI